MVEVEVDTVALPLAETVILILPPRMTAPTASKKRKIEETECNKN